MPDALEPLHITDVRVPQVRLVELDKLNRVEAKATLLADASANLISVEVTRHASGPGDYKLLLNNWDPNRLEHKYNDLEMFRFGKRLRIDMRYMGPQHLALGKDADTGWVPMIAGPITDLQFSFGAEGSRISVTGEDDLRPLKDQRGNTAKYKDNERDIVERTLKHRQYPLRLDVRVPDTLKFIVDNSTQNKINETHEKGQSYLDYIQKFVDRYDLELFLAFDTPDDIAAITQQSIHLVGSRANEGPTDPIVLLRLGHELLDFSPTIKVADQFTSTRVRGRNRFRDEPKGVDGKAGSKDVKKEVDKYVEPGDPPLVPAPDVRRHFFDGENPADDEKTNLDEYRAEAMALAKLLRRARELMVVQATTVGLPRLRPGRYVRVEGIKRPFDGLYYVTSTTHTWGSDGTRTRLTAQRAGMPLEENAS